MAMQILSDEMYELLMAVKNAQKSQPDLTMEQFTGTDVDDTPVYNDDQMKAIMDFWDKPLDNYIKASELTQNGQKLEEMSASFKEQLARSEERNNEAIKALSDRVEDGIKKNGETLAQSLNSAFEKKQYKAIEDLQAKQEQALKESEERQQKRFEDFSSKLFDSLDAKLSSFSSAVALQLDEIKSTQKPTQPSAEGTNGNESVAESKPESKNDNENNSENTSEQPEQAAEPENSTVNTDKSETDGNEQPEGTEGGAAPEVKPEPENVPENKAEAESEPVSKDVGADAHCEAETVSSESGEQSGGRAVHESMDAYSADFVQIIVELRTVNRSLGQLREDFSSLKSDLDELKKEVSEMSCISSAPLEPKDSEKTDGSDDVINKIVKETAMSSLLTSPLAILDATLRKYRDSFAQRYAAAMGCLMAQDGEVNLQFGRNAQQSLDLVTKNSADYQHAVMALTQSPVAPKAPKADVKSEHPQSVGVKKPVKSVSHTTVKRNDVKRGDERKRSEHHSQETPPKSGDQSYEKLISDVNGGELK